MFMYKVSLTVKKWKALKINSILLEFLSYNNLKKSFLSIGQIMSRKKYNDKLQGFTIRTAYPTLCINMINIYIYDFKDVNVNYTLVVWGVKRLTA